MVVRLDADGIKRTTDLSEATDMRYRKLVKDEIVWKTPDSTLTVEIHKALGGA